MTDVRLATRPTAFTGLSPAALRERFLVADLFGGGAQRLCDRREVDVVCLDGSGTVTSDSTEFTLVAEDVVCLGQGTERLSVAGEAETIAIRDAGRVSRRTLRKYMHADGATSCELALGITTLEPGYGRPPSDDMDPVATADLS